MGKLREKAETELKAQKENAEAARKEQLERHKREHEERMQPVVDWLSEWSGEKVTADMLQKVKRPIPLGPPEWDVTIDGFELRVSAAGRDPEPLQVSIEQNVEGGGYRPINEPWELLESEPVAAP